MIYCCATCKFGKENINGVLCKISEQQMEKSDYCLSHVYKEVKQKFESEETNE